MNKENLPAIRKFTMLDRIKSVFNQWFRRGVPIKDYINDTKPDYYMFNSVEMMQIIQSEMKLRNAMTNNKLLMATHVHGVSLKDAENVLKWVVQTAREGLFNNEEGAESSLQGCCGFGQAATAIPLLKMGLKPNINQVAHLPYVNVGNHAFVTVSIPIKDGNKVKYIPFLIDTTFRQFFQTRGPSFDGIKIVDKEFGKVSLTEGYLLSKTEKGKEFSNELLQKGFIELTPENAKLYCDAFVNSGNKERITEILSKRKINDEVLDTEITGNAYIRHLFDPKNHSEIDYTEKELNGYGLNTKTPIEQQIQKQKMIPKFRPANRRDTAEFIR